MLEVLEDRVVPATHIWQGPASGGLWSNAANWSGGVPTTGEAGGTFVQFNGNIDSTDDIANLTVDQVHFTNGGNTIRGLGTALGINGLNNLQGDLQNDTGVNTLDASLPLVLSSGAIVGAKVTAGQLTVNGNISGSTGIFAFLSSGGSLVLAGNNSYTGQTGMDGGNLSLTGNSPACTGVTVASNGTLTLDADYSGSPFLLQGGILADTGTVQSIGPAGNGNQISPGSGSALGTLTTAAGAFASVLKGSTLQAKVNGAAGADQLIIGNGATVDLTGATLSVNVVGSATGTVYTLVSSATGGISGTFAGLANGATFSAGGRSFRINYTANAVTLTDVSNPPSPKPPAPGGGGAAAGLDTSRINFDALLCVAGFAGGDALVGFFGLADFENLLNNLSGPDQALARQVFNQAVFYDVLFFG
jgi:hypothetical protein